MQRGESAASYLRPEDVIEAIHPYRTSDRSNRAIATNEAGIKESTLPDPISFQPNAMELPVHLSITIQWVTEAGNDKADRAAANQRST